MPYPQRSTCKQLLKQRSSVSQPSVIDYMISSHIYMYMYMIYLSKMMGIFLLHSPHYTVGEFF